MQASFERPNIGDSNVPSRESQTESSALNQEAQRLMGATAGKTVNNAENSQSLVQSGRLPNLQIGDNRANQGGITTDEDVRAFAPTEKEYRKQNPEYNRYMQRREK